jgi:hypothetical protein
MEPQSWPEPAAEVARAVRAKYYGREVPLPVAVRDRFGELLADAEFASAFRVTGPRGWPPGRLALVTVFQMAENLTDRQAAEAVRDPLNRPCYAGAFAYGRHQQKPTSSGKIGPTLRPREEWIALFPDHHPGYITFAQYEANQAKLTANAVAHGKDRRHGPPREGPALLQGIAVCGICGRRMTVRYHQRKDDLQPEYVCQAKGIEYGNPICQRVHGVGVDAAVGQLLVKALTPLALEAALAVAEELATRADEAD